MRLPRPHKKTILGCVNQIITVFVTEQLCGNQSTQKRHYHRDIANTKPLLVAIFSTKFVNPLIYVIVNIISVKTKAN